MIWEKEGQQHKSLARQSLNAIDGMILRKTQRVDAFAVVIFINILIVRKGAPKYR